MSQLTCNDILNWLTPISYGPVQSNYIRKRQKDTGQWLLDSTVFNAWVATEQKTLFCPGIPGAGKTILTSIVVDRLTSEFEGDPSVGVGYIYCNFKRSNEQSIHDLLANLLKQLLLKKLVLNQLAEDSAPLPQIVENLYTRHQAHRTKPSREELSAALHSVAAKYSRVFIVIDALDECQSDGCWAGLLAELFNLQNSQRINIFATSRHVPEIIDQFKGKSESLEIRASDQDVERFLDMEIQNLGLSRACVRENHELQQEIKTGIAKSAGGMFLLAQIYINTLSGKTSTNEIRSALRAFQNQNPESSGDREVIALKTAYEQTIKRIKNQQPGQVKLAMSILAWLTCAKRQLTKSELQHALATRLGAAGFDPDDVPGTDVMVSVCAGLVTVDEESGIIRLLHYTTQQYLQTDQRWVCNAEIYMAETCVTYLSFDIFESGPYEKMHELRERCHVYQLYHYAACNWGHHARAALTEQSIPTAPGNRLFQQILAFIQSGAKMLASCQVMDNPEGHQYWLSVYQGMTSIHLAACFGLKRIITNLLANGYDIDVRGHCNETPLHAASDCGQEAAARLLLEFGADIEARNWPYHQTPLHLAASDGNERVVKLLLDKGANIDAKDNEVHSFPMVDDEYGGTPLCLAVVMEHEAVVRLLLEKGADVEAENNDGVVKHTPLFLAAWIGNEDIVRLLIENGADIEVKDKDEGFTALHQAAKEGHTDVVRVLLEAGADIEARYRPDEATPLATAAGAGRTDVVELLLEKGADIEARNDGRETGHTPLFLAAWMGHEDVVCVLILKGADIEVKDEGYACTALHQAAKEGHTDVVRVLLHAGANIETRGGRDNTTPLFTAVKNGKTKIVKLLLEKGADIEARSWGDKEALNPAKDKTNHEALDLLAGKKAEIEEKEKKR